VSRYPSQYHSAAAAAAATTTTTTTIINSSIMVPVAKLVTPVTKLSSQLPDIQNHSKI